MSAEVKLSEDEVISGCTLWASRSSTNLLSVIRTHQDNIPKSADISLQTDLAPLFLDQVDDNPCVITLQCGPHQNNVITSLLVISEARTIEVYSASGEYCGTCRGERDLSFNAGDTDNGPFYRKYLKLENPASSCDVKLLSLGGRTSVGVAGIHVAVRALEVTAETGPALGAAIDLQQVQSMMEDMGTTLSPGAQHLMDMVQFQQKSKMDTMAGFFPLLMGSGALSGLTKGPSVSLPHATTAAARLSPLPPPAPPPSPSPFTTTIAAQLHRPHPDSEQDQEQASPNNAPLTERATRGCDGHRPGLATATASPQFQRAAAAPTGSLSQGKLAQEVMSALMRTPPGQHCAATPDLLPLLQSVCCQVAQLRMDDTVNAAAAVMAQAKAHMPNGPSEVHACCKGLEEVLEKRLQEMEIRLKEHMDQRLDSLEQKLTSVLQQLHNSPT